MPMPVKVIVCKESVIYLKYIILWLVELIKKKARSDYAIQPLYHQGKQEEGPTAGNDGCYQGLYIKPFFEKMLENQIRFNYAKYSNNKPGWLLRLFWSKA